MDFDLHSRLTYELKLLRHEKQLCVSRLEDLGNYANMNLKSKPQNKGRLYYYASDKGESDYKYVNLSRQGLIPKVKEAHHLEEALERINKNETLIDSLLTGYKDYDLATVDEVLPDVYKDSRRIITSRYQEVGRKWKDEQLLIQATFPENYPERKVHTASDKILLKSISELVVYERFLGAGLATIYEMPIASVDYGPNLYPDFTILSPVDLKTVIIVEFVGLLDNTQYRDDFARRVYRLMRNGYTPGVNLFFIFGDLEGHIDSLQINKVIADIMGLR